MTKIKVRGIVLREYEAGESDKRLLIFCKEHGRLFAYARGARKPTSKFMAASQPFTYADFILVQGRGFYSLAHADIIENFYTLREDYDRLMAAHTVAEVLEKTLWDDIESDDLLKLSLRTFLVLSKGRVEPLQALSVFLFRFFDVFGLRPQTDGCVLCDTQLSEMLKPMICSEGLICHTHKPITYQSVTHTAIKAMQHILDSQPAEAFLFSAADSVILELKKVASMLWSCHFEWELSW